MRDEILQFFRDIWPESYHIEDVPFILGYKDEEIKAYFSILHDLETAGSICIKDGEYATYQKTENRKLLGIYKASKKRVWICYTYRGKLTRCIHSQWLLRHSHA